MLMQLILKVSVPACPPVYILSHYTYSHIQTPYKLFITVAIVFVVLLQLLSLEFGEVPSGG